MRFLLRIFFRWDSESWWLQFGHYLGASLGHGMKVGSACAFAALQFNVDLDSSPWVSICRRKLETVTVKSKLKRSKSLEKAAQSSGLKKVLKWGEQQLQFTKAMSWLMKPMQDHWHSIMMLGIWNMNVGIEKHVTMLKQNHQCGKYVTRHNSQGHMIGDSGFITGQDSHMIRLYVTAQDSGMTRLWISSKNSICSPTSFFETAWLASFFETTLIS